MIDTQDHQHAVDKSPTPTVLHGVLANEGTARSATEQLQERLLDVGLPGLRPRRTLPPVENRSLLEQTRATPELVMQR